MARYGHTRELELPQGANFAFSTQEKHQSYTQNDTVLKIQAATFTAISPMYGLNAYGQGVNHPFRPNVEGWTSFFNI